MQVRELMNPAVVTVEPSSSAALAALAPGFERGDIDLPIEEHLIVELYSK